MSMSRTSSPNEGEWDNFLRKLTEAFKRYYPQLKSGQFQMIRVIGNKRLPLVVYICVQPMLYPYTIGVGRVVLSELQGVQTLNRR